MLQVFLAIALASAAPVSDVPECTAPWLSYFYDARDVTAEGYSKTCFICADSMTLQTEAWGVVHKATRTIRLPDLTTSIAAVQKAPTDELCDGPMDVAGVEYWLNGEPPVLFSAAGSACWIQSTAPEAAAMEALVDRFCGGVAFGRGPSTSVQ